MMPGIFYFLPIDFVLFFLNSIFSLIFVEMDTVTANSNVIEGRFIHVFKGTIRYGMSMGDQQDDKDIHQQKGPLLTDPPFYLPEFERSYRYIIDEYEVSSQRNCYFYALCCTETL